MRTDFFIKLLTVLELICYGLLIVNRVNVIKATNDIDEGLREVITFHEYEHGWNIVFLLILLVSCALTLAKKKAAWVLRQTGLISLTISFLSPFNFAAVLTIFLSGVYWHKQVMHFFGVEDEKLKYISMVAGGVGLLTAMRLLFSIID